MTRPWDGQLYRHPAISVPVGVFIPINVEILRDRPDLEIEQGMIMQISMAPNGWVSLGTYGATGSGTCYAEVADDHGKTIDAQEGVDFRILPAKGANHDTEA